MKWSNLKKNNCPQCGKNLTTHYFPMTKTFECPCGYKIGEMKYKQIVSKNIT